MKSWLTFLCVRRATIYMSSAQETSKEGTHNNEISRQICTRDGRKKSRFYLHSSQMGIVLWLLSKLLSYLTWSIGVTLGVYCAIRMERNIFYTNKQTIAYNIVTMIPPGLMESGQFTIKTHGGEPLTSAFIQRGWTIKGCTTTVDNKPYFCMDIVW